MDPWLDRWRRASTWLDATPAELVALATMLIGATIAAIVMLRPTATGAVPIGSAAGGHVAPTRAPAQLFVHVVGAVVTPGVVVLDGGARVTDALAAAGGPTLEASLGALNLARPVTDGEQLVVPRAGGDEFAGTGDPETDATSAWRPDGRLDLNRASASDFEELPGIGPVLASRIVSWRDAQGRFDDVGQLREVAGIGEKTFQSLAPLVVV